MMKLHTEPSPVEATSARLAAASDVRRDKLARRYRKVAAWALGCTLFVILWGALVRIEGAGRGCGNHWPLCNGELLPRFSAVNMLIELTHRVTTLAGLLSVGACVLAFLAFPKGHAARLTSVLTVVFLLIEGAIGAALVLLDHVADDTSVARGYWMTGHLCNTFVLLGFMLLAVLTASNELHASDEKRDAWPDTSARTLQATFAVGAGIVIVGATGAIAALSDTLFPAKSLAEGLQADLSPSAHVFVTLRGLHPFAAVAVALAGLALSAACAKSGFSSVRAWATRLGGAIAVQVMLGVMNLALLAPGPLQLLHLLVADLVWLAAVGLGWSLYRARGSSAGVGRPQPVASSR